MHDSQHRSQPPLRYQSAIRAPRKNLGKVQIVAFVAFFAAAVLFTLATAAHESIAVVSGTVVDAESNPVTGAEVLLSDGPWTRPRVARLWPGETPERPRLVRQTRADDAGVFSIDLPNDAPETHGIGTWLVLWAHRPGSSLATYLVGRDWPARAAPIELRLAAWPPLPLVVVGPDEKPVPNARVLPEQVNDLRLPRELAEQLAATTDSEGHTMLHDLTPDSLDLVRIETERFGVQWASLPVADARGLPRIALAPVGAVRGRLTADDPRAVAAVPVRLATWTVSGDDASGGGLAEATTDADGCFHVRAIAAGALSASLTLHAELPFRSDRIVGRPVVEETTNEMTIYLKRAVRVEGVVRDRDSGEPLAGAGVRLDYLLPRGFSCSDAQGNYGAFRLPGSVSPSPWRMPRHYYFPQYTLDTQPAPADAERVLLKPLLLARGASLRGRVIDPAGHGVAAAEIEAHWELPSRGEILAHAISDRDGAFTLDGVSPQALLWLSVSSSSGATAEAITASATDGKTVDLAVDQANSLDLEGRVVDPEDRPIAGAIVRIAWQRRNARGRWEDDGIVSFSGRQRLVTDTHGRFQTPRVLMRGREYRAEVTARGMSPTMTEFIDPTRRKSAALGDIVMEPIPPLRSVEGRVVDRRGMPAAGLRVFQAGDGPQRTATTTDSDGRFRLRGLQTGPVFLLASGDGYPPQGLLIADDAKPVELTVRRAEEPAARLTTLPEPLSPAERRKTALRLIEPLLPALKEEGPEDGKVWVLGTLATLNPDRLSEFAGLPAFSRLGFDDTNRYVAALALVREDIDEALALAEAIGTPRYRARLYLAAGDALSDGQRQRKAELLAAALLHARSEPDVGERVELMSRIAERWLDFGETERGTALLREGQKLAEQLPPPSEAAVRAHDSTAHSRARFGASLARIDGPAALRLSAGFTSQWADYYRCQVARRLAVHDPAAAERMLDGLVFATARYWQALPMLHQMAAVDAARAARLARRCEADNQRGYALGIVAHGAARRDAAQAKLLLHEAYELLERASASGMDRDSAPEHPAVLAAALLPVAERIDPELVEPCLWRAMALRPPRVRPGANNSSPAVVAAFAMFISRYDRDAARAVAALLTERARLMVGDDEYFSARYTWSALAAVDARWAESLMEAMPEPSTLDLRAAKNVARRHMAETLEPSAGTWWHKLYERVLSIYDPDAPDDLR